MATMTPKLTESGPHTQENRNVSLTVGFWAPLRQHDVRPFHSFLSLFVPSGPGTRLIVFFLLCLPHITFARPLTPSNTSWASIFALSHGTLFNGAMFYSHHPMGLVRILCSDPFTHSWLPPTWTIPRAPSTKHR